MRKFNAYETNLLIQYGFDIKKVSSTVDDNIPVEYIIGIANFYENEFYVNQNTLIPRLETEFLIELALSYTTSQKKVSIKFADIGTGSGAIGITFGLELIKRNIHFDGTISDISAKAIKVAEKNLSTYSNLVEKKIPIKILVSDFFKNYPKGSKFDIIFANLPYIPSGRIHKLPVSVRGYEPLTALDGGEDGLDLTRKFLSEAKKFIKTDGIALLEVDDTHTKNLTKEFEGSWKIEIKNDCNGKNRFWVCKLLYNNSKT